MASEKKITMREYNGTDYDTLYPKTIAEQVEGVYTQQQILADSTKALYGLESTATPDDLFKLLGGLRAVIRVFAPVGASVSMTKGEKTFTTVADSMGEADLYPSEFGEWTVTVSSVSKTINVDTVTVYYLVMPNIESISWSQVKAICDIGLARTLFHIGDEKTLTVNGVSYTAVIIGFDHDTPVDIAAYGRDKAYITWQMKNCLNATYKMNSSNTSKGGWTNCAMRTSTMVTLLNQMASDLKNFIVKVKKLSSAGNQSTAINTTEDFLFLLSEVEVFGSAPYSVNGEGYQYEYYQSANSRVKTVAGSASIWWERSPTTASNVGFCIVGTDGSNGGFGGANNSFGVSFAFCI